MKQTLIPRLPTEAELTQLFRLEERKIRQNNIIDQGDLQYLVENSAITVFDNFEGNAALKDYYPQIYTGKYMLVAWDIRSVSSYVWINNQLTQIDETNKETIWQ